MDCKLSLLLLLFASLSDVTTTSPCPATVHNDLHCDFLLERSHNDSLPYCLCAGRFDVVEVGSTVSITLSTSPPLNDSVWLNATLNPIMTLKLNGSVELGPYMTAFSNETSTVISFKAVRAGQSVLSFVNSDDEDENIFKNIQDVTRASNVVHLLALNILSDVIGWAYFVAWSISFYPQVFLNCYKRSVVGLSFDFLALNLTGFMCYAAFNLGLFLSPLIKGQYLSRHPGGINPVQINDIVFSLHAVLLTAFTIFQCFIFKRSKQKVSWIVVAILILMYLVMLVCLIVSIVGPLQWLDYLYVLSYVKLAVTLIKYIPQVYMNFKRKSTEGWSIGNVLLDFAGGSLSILQMFLLSYNYGKPASLFNCNDPDWAPTLDLGHAKLADVSTSQDAARHSRLSSRRKRQQLPSTQDSDEDDPSLEDDPTTMEDDPTLKEHESGTSSQTELSGTSVVAMQEELQRLITENAQLKETLASTTVNEDFFKDEETVKEYTGLPDKSTLMALYNYVEKYISHTGSSALTKFQQLVLAVMRLRLNSSHFELANKFGITRSTSSKIFLNVLDVLFVRLSPLIYWPEREQLRETMPMSFRTHFQSRVVVIVDCFEVFIDRPSGLCARAQTWSSYKHHNTAKFLIGIAPQGVISFISKAWGGRASDKHIMEHCGILKALNPGDEVLADRGFTVAESGAMVGARLSIPSFTKGCSQLKAVDVETTRKIANVRIHVERVIGSLRQKYTILRSTLPLEFMTSTDHQPCTIDKIATVCCALTNLCPSVVSFE